LVEDHCGALIVIERDIGLRTFIESGVPLDAKVSRDLLCAIFQRRGALHDGAVIIQGDRIAAAACFLPLTTNPAVLNNLGTRHRAAIGITEDSDALAVVVSEDLGQISVAAHGELEPNVSPERLQQLLTLSTSGRPIRREPVPEPERVQL
jgi:diadenylate cyclase